MILSNKAIGPWIQKAEQPEEGYCTWPEKVLQFGTGVLLRALPDFYIDQANKQGFYKGRVVVVKSTGSGETAAFDKQDGLYTVCVRGIHQGEKIDENNINASISRVLSATASWSEILQCAANPDMELIISNTTEVGIVLAPDDIGASPPATFPGKLLAYLFRRYQIFNGDPAKGMVIIPTELIPDNGPVLAGIVKELAIREGLDSRFLNWLEQSNYFCSSLVDRIVPGKLPSAQQAALEKALGYEDELMIMCEPYNLWAIESKDQKVKDTLSFSRAAPGLIIAPDIQKFRELKLRLLNGPHSFGCGYAYLLGFRTVKEGMEDPGFSAYIKNLLFQEIIPAIQGAEISADEAIGFATSVLDRFSNPFIEHQWISITLQYSLKMRTRNVPLLTRYYEKFNTVPSAMALGFAAHLRFMKSTRDADGQFYGTVGGERYPVKDAQAGYYEMQWRKDSSGLVRHVLGNRELWGTDLLMLPGFEAAVAEQLHWLMEK